MPSYTQKKQKACYMQSMNANSETHILLILPSLIKIFYLRKTKHSLTKSCEFCFVVVVSLLLFLRTFTLQWFYKKFLVKNYYLLSG